MIGPDFYNELVAAGLNGLPFSWSSDGTIFGRENLTAQQNSSLDAVIAAHNPNLQLKNIVPFQTFITRWTDPEYLALMRARANAITAGNITLVKQWDFSLAYGFVDLNTLAAQNFKSAIVTAGILTQPRADIIFS
jgi:hypothetical protein